MKEWREGGGSAVHVGSVGVGLGNVAHEDTVNGCRVDFAVSKCGFGCLDGQVSA